MDRTAYANESMHLIALTPPVGVEAPDKNMDGVADSQRSLRINTREDFLITAHVSANFSVFDEQFGSVYESDRSTQFLTKKTVETTDSTRGILFANRVTNYQSLIPHLYREDGIIRDIDTETLFAELSAIPSVIPKDEFEVSHSGMITKFLSVFMNRTIKKEQTLHGEVTQFLTAVCGHVCGFFSTMCVPQSEKVLSGASGLLCKLRDDFSIDMDAGFLGNADQVYEYGSPDEEHHGGFCVVEFKIADEPANGETRYYRQGRALFAQTILSLIGHQARMALAMTIHGLKVILLKKDAQDPTRITLFKWPPGNEFLLYRRNREDASEAARLFCEIARICMRDNSVSESLLQENFATPVKRATKAPEVDTDKKLDSALTEVEERLGRRLFNPDGSWMEQPSDATLWTVVPSTGEKIFFTTLDVDARFDRQVMTRLCQKHKEHTANMEKWEAEKTSTVVTSNEVHLSKTVSQNEENRENDEPQASLTPVL